MFYSSTYDGDKYLEMGEIWVLCEEALSLMISPIILLGFIGDFKPTYVIILMFLKGIILNFSDSLRNFMA